MLFDLHTHTAIHDPGVVAIRSVHALDARTGLPEGYCSVGFHPWHIRTDDADAAIGVVEEMSVLERVVAIGECGLDRAIRTHIDEQTEIFLRQVRIAERVRKPLIIHSVRAYSDLMGFRKHCDSEIPWIVHGFTSNRDVAYRLLEQGMYLSFGTALLDGDGGVRDVFPLLPLERIFLESDEHGSDIRKIYDEAALLREIDVAALTAAINDTVLRIIPGIDERTLLD